MINFPIFKNFNVGGYALYPGPSQGQPGLHITFNPGLTLVVGANGLGKTTLVTLLYRMLTGPFDIPNLLGRGELGSLKLEATSLSPSTKNMFANRVSDRATGATAELKVALGDHELKIERRLSNLSLQSFSIDSIRQPTDEGSFQSSIVRLTGLGSFGDFILMLRYLVFYFEDRRALVWDPTAQKQLLRMLFLPPETAQNWTKQERTILEEDSRTRNLQAAMTREERSFSENVIKAQGGAKLRQQLKAHEDLQGTDRARLANLDDQTVGLDEWRQKARLSHLEAEQNREARFRGLERAKLAAIDARFPGHAESGKYVLAHLMSEHSCLVCGNQAPKAAAIYAQRLASKKCVVCESDLRTSGEVIAPADVADKRVGKEAESLAHADQVLTGARGELERAENEYRQHTKAVAELQARIAERSVQIDTIIRALPKTEVEIREQRDAVAAMRGRVETLKLGLQQMRSEFQSFVAQWSLLLVESSKAIQDSFSEYAQGFLNERTMLSWSPHKAQVGQGGEAISFPAFDLDMSGSDFDEPVRREGPEDVSESQREFIDLAFRMALMKTASSHGIGSLIIDAPESSLDAVFAKRAGIILTRFGSPDIGNRLIITSNLIEGSLIPSLVAAANAAGNRDTRLVDLFTIARPTAAIREAEAEYTDIRRRFLGAS